MNEIDLWDTVGSLVFVMKEAKLSWSQREVIAEAIQACATHYASLETERAARETADSGGSRLT